MIFSRTVNGINNYNSFYQVELMVYIEDLDEDYKNDSKYYEALICAISNFKKIKIKPIGNCVQLIEFFDNIKLNLKNDSLFIVDKDLCGVNKSFICHPNLITTYGYSWENDFWSKKLILKLIDYLLAGNEIDINEFNTTYLNIVKSAHILSCYDVIAQINGYSILQKNKSSFGVSLSYSSHYKNLIVKSEEIRIKRKLKINECKNCSISRSIFKIARIEEPFKVIQGHFWEALVLKIITCFYKINSRDSSSIPYNTLKNRSLAKIIF